ncbi:unnamed protein product [Plutella xylostella]|uniref:(diamondback moth) hypothetical protein n=1 Tax=Plutella xylostella TaxID=51655 RepID=A0A8S4DTK3_PLUXY|nr:unnamed protein product [Plutella xylostella]
MLLNPPTHVILAGFGNIAAGQVSVWDARSPRRLGACAAPATTWLQWGPRAECFLTATTYPRLTTGNQTCLGTCRLRDAATSRSVLRRRTRLYSDIYVSQNRFRVLARETELPATSV